MYAINSRIDLSLSIMIIISSRYIYTSIQRIYALRNKRKYGLSRVEKAFSRAEIISSVRGHKRGRICATGKPSVPDREGSVKVVEVRMGKGVLAGNSGKRLIH